MVSLSPINLEAILLQNLKRIGLKVFTARVEHVLQNCFLLIPSLFKFLKLLVLSEVHFSSVSVSEDPLLTSLRIGVCLSWDMAPYTQDMPTPANDDFLVEKFSLRTTMNFRQFNDDDDDDERLLHYGKIIQTDEAQFQSVF